MERVNFSYSLNNIPIPSKNAYLKNMTFKLESFIKRIRWKAFFYEKLENTSEAITDNSGFKSVRTSPKMYTLMHSKLTSTIWYVTSNLRELIQN